MKKLGFADMDADRILVGPKCQGKPPATLPSKRTVILRAIGADGASCATMGVPPKPVVRQNQLYSGTAA